jgi:hypothetical protein
MNPNTTRGSVFDLNHRYTDRAQQIESELRCDAAKAFRDCMHEGNNARVAIVKVSRNPPYNHYIKVSDDEFAYLWMNAVNDYAIGLLLGVEE